MKKVKNRWEDCVFDNTNSTQEENIARAIAYAILHENEESADHIELLLRVIDSLDDQLTDAISDLKGIGEFE